MKSKILVTSAAGKTGMSTSLQLLEKGYPVRALVRQKDARAKLLSKAGAGVLRIWMRLRSNMCRPCLMRDGP